ncbi:hypothetical protein Pr1d_32460 [Bythopirellula goksoeyrii]|uniref:Uncharacterized protein n=1 Tax=Bythopirellula goksoeyrii TaxID=1400387 RepID=A0A5B9QAN7_9BACT|nr:hypothetical protein Pr1d_32460 [Bythopirellula goksoeyrii]
MFLSPCCNCVNKAHCSRCGLSHPCKYYVDPALEEMPKRLSELAVQLLRPAILEGGHTEIQQPRKERCSQNMTASARAEWTVRMHSARPHVVDPIGG